MTDNDNATGTTSNLVHVTSPNALPISFRASATYDGNATSGAVTIPASVQAGDAHLGRGEYAKAIALYKQALSKGVTDSDIANTHLEIALASSGDKAGAKAAFTAVTGAQRADIAAFWLTWLDTPPTS